MVAPLSAVADGRVLVGPETGDDAGVYRFEGTALVATADFITPVSDDPVRFGRVAATNSISDVYAMGGRPLFALNLCCFPEGLPMEVAAEILRGGAEALTRAGAVLLGGHTVKDDELKYGLAVIGQADPDRLLTNAGARAGDRLVLTKPLGTGAMINAFKADELDAAGLEPALRQMERLNDEASAAALRHGARGCTDITGFGLAGHALGMARASGVTLTFRFSALPSYPAFFDVVRRGVTTGSTCNNLRNVERHLRDDVGLRPEQRELLCDPQTSGGLLIALPGSAADALLEELLASGHTAAVVGEVLAGPPAIVLT